MRHRRKNGAAARKQRRRNTANVGVIVAFATAGLFKTAAVSVYVQLTAMMELDDACGDSNFCG